MLTLFVIISVTTVSCKNNGVSEVKQATAENTTDGTETSSPGSAQVEDKSEGDISDLDALGDIEVEKELFDVNLIVPAQYFGELEQEKLLEEMCGTINSSLSEMISSENYPNFTDITANEDFTDFTVTTRSTEILTATGLYLRKPCLKN